MNTKLTKGVLFVATTEDLKQSNENVEQVWSKKKKKISDIS